MAPIDRVKNSTTTKAVAVLPSVERQNLLKDSKLVGGDPRWEKSGFRRGHLQLYFALDALHRFMKGKAPASELKEKLQAWLKEEDFAKGKNKAFNEKVLESLHAQLGKLRTEENVRRANQVRRFLPAPVAKKEVKVPVPAKKAPPPSNISKISNKDRYWNVGLAIGQDSGILDLMNLVGIPLRQFAPEHLHLAVKPSLEIPFYKDVVGQVRLNLAAFRVRGVPGSSVNPTKEFDPGTGFRAGLELGLVNANSPKHLLAGVGFELNTIIGHVGQDQGISGPGPTYRLHFYRKDEIPLFHKYTGKLRLGFSTFFNIQETNVVVGDERLLGQGQNTPMSFSGNLFARNAFRFVEFSARYYWNGAPDTTEPHPGQPFTPGEGATKVASLFPSKMVGFTRSRDITGFANNQVYLSAEPLGAKGSRDQYDQLSLGLTFFSLLDGSLIADNARIRSEIWRRGSWIHRGAMLALDGIELAWNIIGAATRDADPLRGQTVEQFAANPGSVTDFIGRAHDLRWKLNLWEQGLSALDASGILGSPTDKSLFLYKLSGGIAAGLGLAGFLLSAPLSGRGCGPSGGLLACSFHGTREKSFEPGIDHSPSSMTKIENQYAMSVIMASSLVWGINRLFYSRPEKPTKKGSSAKKDSRFVSAYGQVGSQGFVLGARGTF